VGKRDEKALGQGWVQVRSLAPVPELITGVWSVWNSAERKWVEAPELRISADDSVDDDMELVPAGGGLASPPLSSIPKALPMESKDDVIGGGSSDVGGTSCGASSASSAALALSSTSQPVQAGQIFLLHEVTQDAHGRILHERVTRVNDFLRAAGCTTWFSAERVQGNVLDMTCAAIDESDIVLVFVSQRSLDRVAGKNGAYDTLKKEFEYAERTKGADRLVPVVIDASARTSRDWGGGIGMVLGSRPFTDLSVDPTELAWDANLHSLLDEISLLRGGTSAPSSGVHSATPAAGYSSSTTTAAARDGLSSAAVAPPTPERRELPASKNASPAPATMPKSTAGPAQGERTMAQKVARVREELSLDPSLPIAKAVAEANAVMGLEGHGPLAKQVEALLTELGVL